MYIVNPWIFYFAGICEGLKTLAIIISVISLIYIVCRWCLWLAGEVKSFWWDKKNKNSYNYWSYFYDFCDSDSFTEYLL